MMTALFDSQMFEVTTFTDQRSEPYYKQYHHCLIWWVPESNMMRQLSHKSIDTNIHWRNNYLTNWGKANKMSIAQRDQQRLHEICDRLLTVKNPFKKVVCNNTMWLYTNTPEDFADIIKHEGTQLFSHKQADVCLPSDCVVLNRPKHKFRTYFRERWLDDDQLGTLRKYFNTRSSQFRAGPGFKQMLLGRRMWLASYYFVDHDDEKSAFFINLACPNLVRKTVPIQARN